MKLVAPIVCASLIVLASCEQNPDGSFGQIGGETWYETSSPEAKAAYFSRVCAGYGFKPDTPQLAQCVAQEARQARQTYQANLAMAATAFTAPQLSVQPMGRFGVSTPTTTNCQRVGNMLNCTSY